MDNICIRPQFSAFPSSGRFIRIARTPQQFRYRRPSGNMNALIYCTPDMDQASYRDITSMLKPLLSSNYAVQTVSEDMLLSDPWQTNCAILILPKCNKSPHISVGAGIQRFLCSGGSVLAFSCGAKWKVIEDSSLTSSNLSGATSCCFIDYTQALIFHMLWSPHNLSVSFQGPRHPSVERVSFESQNMDEVITCVLFSGKLMLWKSSPAPQDSKQLKDSLTILGIKIASSGMQTLTESQPQYIAAARKEIAERFVNNLLEESQSLEDRNNTFIFCDFDGYSTDTIKKSSSCQSERSPNYIILPKDSDLPSPHVTPSFRLDIYFEQLSQARRNIRLETPTLGHGLGDILMYSECVTSTQTMLDKYDAGAY